MDTAKKIASRFKKRKKLMLTGVMSGITMAATAKMPTNAQEFVKSIGTGFSGVMGIIEIVIIIGLGIGLATTIYMVVTKNPHSREWIIGLIVGFVLYFVFFNMLTIPTTAT